MNKRFSKNSKKFSANSKKMLSHTEAMTEEKNKLKIKKIKYTVKTVNKLEINIKNYKHKHQKQKSFSNASNKKVSTTTANTEKKKKHILIKKLQAKNLKLFRNVSEEDRLSDCELLKIIKNLKLYKRYCFTLYAFNYWELLYKKYHYIINLQSVNRTLIITEKNKWHLLNSASTQKLYQKFLNVFNSKKQPKKHTSKANKNVHDNSTNIYVFSVTKSEKYIIEKVNHYILVKSAFSNHLKNNISKENNNNDKKKWTNKQWNKLKKMSLCIAEWEIKIDRLKKMLIKFDTDNIIIERNELYRERNKLYKINKKLMQKLMKLTEIYIKLKNKHINLQQWYNSLQHAQDYLFNEDVNFNFMMYDAIFKDEMRIQKVSILLSSHHTTISEK